MILAAIVTSSWAGDITLLAVIIGMFGTILKMQVDQKTLQNQQANSRKEEIKQAIAAAISASPEKVVVSPQPFLVEMREEFVRRKDNEDDLSEIRRRLGNLEAWRERDSGTIANLATQISALPQQVVNSLLAQIQMTNAIFAPTKKP